VLQVHHVRTKTVNRCSHAIVKEILAVCCHGALRTELMEKHGLGGSQSKQYLAWAVAHDFLEVRNGITNGYGRKVKKYYTTARGHILLIALENLGLIMEDKYLLPTPFLCSG